MRILVTGANGFIGRQAVHTLKAAGHWVRAAGRERFDLARIEADDLTVAGDIGPETEWSAALQDIEAVLHLAGLAHQMHPQAAGDLDAFHQVNMLGTLTLARAAAEAGCRRFVFASSIAANGPPPTDTYVLTEADPVRPVTAYGRSKAEAEAALAGFCPGAGLSFTAIRPPLVIGPGAPGNLRRLRTLARSGLPLPFAAIANRHSYISRRNLCALFEKALTAERLSPVYLAADSPALSTARLLALAAEGLNRPSRLFPAPHWLLKVAASAVRRRGELEKLISSHEIDASLAKRELGWHAVEAIDDAVRESFRLETDPLLATSASS